MAIVVYLCTMPRKRDKNGLPMATYKEKTFAKHYVLNKGNGQAAAMVAYDADANNAQVIASQLLDKEPVQREIHKILTKAGLTMESVSEGLHDIFEAGTKNSKKATPDHAIAIGNMVYKLNGAYPGTKHTQISLGRKETIGLNITATIEELKTITEKTNSLLKELTRSNR